MWLYLLWFFIPVLVYCFSARLSRSTNFLALYLTALALFVGLADMLGGYDRYIYGALFDSLADDMAAGISPWNSSLFAYYPRELGYDFLNVLVASLTSNRYIAIFVFTVIAYIFLYISFKNLFKNYAFALIIFMGLWFFFTFTYLRQILAVCIGSLSIKYAVEKNPKKFLFLCFCAFCFHNSSIILLPLYFMSDRKLARSKVVILWLICLLIGLTGLPSSSFQTFGHLMGDANRAASTYGVDEGNFRIAYFMEALFFGYFIFRFYDRFSARDPYHLVMMNMSIVYCAILLLFIRSDNGGRIAWFYIFGLISYLTYLVERKLISPQNSVILILLFLFLYIRVFRGWQVFNELYPYKTFLTNGYRHHDFIRDNNEYDFNYDKDKFYRK